MICPKCNADNVFQLIYQNNSHAEYSSNETTYYQCKCCGLYIRKIISTNIDWSEVGYLSDTLA